jgi:hypothetical protein
VVILSKRHSRIYTDIYIYASFSFSGIAIGLFLWFFPRIFFPLFYGFSRGALAEMKAV